MDTNRSLLRILFVFLVGVLSPAIGTFANEKVVVADINGRKVTGELKSWSGNELVVSGESLHNLARQDVRSITFEHPVKKVAGGQPLILLSNGDRLSARPVSIANDSLTISWPNLASSNALKIPLEKIAAIIFELPLAITERHRLFADIATLPPGSDLVMLSNGDRSTGELKQLDASFVELKAAANLLKLDRSRVRAIRLNPELTNATRTTGHRAIVMMSDGSQITTTTAEVADGKLRVKSVAMGNLELPLETISLCELYGERVIPIADYEPAKIEFTPYLSATWKNVRNANVLHGPLTLRGTEFGTGLGMHSRTSTTYNLHGNERAFQCVVGIDDIANGMGSVIFSIELDGRPVWTSLELNGKSPAAIVPEIDLRGGKQLKLVVDFGQFADVSDYADWCDAVLILNSARP